MSVTTLIALTIATIAARLMWAVLAAIFADGDWRETDELRAWYAEIRDTADEPAAVIPLALAA